MKRRCICQTHFRLRPFRMRKERDNLILLKPIRKKRCQLYFSRRRLPNLVFLGFPPMPENLFPAPFLMELFDVDLTLLLMLLFFTIVFDSFSTRNGRQPQPYLLFAKAYYRLFPPLFVLTYFNAFIGINRSNIQWLFSKFITKYFLIKFANLYENLVNEAE